MSKYEIILNDTWEYLENNYKGSEITFEFWLKLIEKKCDNNYCLKQCVKLLWEQWEFVFNEDRQYYKEFLKENYNVKVV